MPEFGISPSDIERLAQLVEENDLSELRYEEGDVKVVLRTASYQPARAAAFAPVPSYGSDASSGGDAFRNPASLSAQSSDAAVPLRPLAARHRLNVEAPIMGVFYRSAAPGEPSFVDVGDPVEIGQVIGVIEAMKVFSEVPSDYAGRVAEIPAKNGGLVQPGDPLIVLEAL